MELAAYARYSSDNQKCESVEEQFREIDDWAAKNAHNIIARYSDYALSGKYDYRPEFERMLEESATAQWRGVVVFDLSRFSRAGEEGIVDNLRLTRNHISLFSVTENFTDDFGGKLYKHVKFLVAEDMIDQLRKNVNRGLRDNAIKNKHNGGTPPLGYNVGADGNLVINDREAEAVKIIFEMFADRQPYIAICKALNERGYKTKRNNSAFGKNSIHEILVNKKYIGVYEYGKLKRTKIRDPNKKCTMARNEDYIINPGGCPAIISEELFNKVQTMKQKREIYNPRAKADYILSGKIICGVCGAKYNGSVMGKDRVPYYQCYNKKTSCDNRNISKYRLEEAVTSQVREALFSVQGKELLERYILDYNKAVSKVDKTCIDDYNRKISTIESRLIRAKEAYLNGDMELKEFHKIKQEATILIGDIPKPAIDKPLDLDIKKLNSIMQKLEQCVCEDRELINLLVEKVIIIGENIDVYLYKTFMFTPPKNPGPKGEPSKNNMKEGGQTPPSNKDKLVEMNRTQRYPCLSFQNGHIIVSFVITHKR